MAWLAWERGRKRRRCFPPCGCLFGGFFSFFLEENELKGNKNDNYITTKKTQNLSENGWMFFFVEVGMIGRR